MSRRTTTVFTESSLGSGQIGGAEVFVVEGADAGKFADLGELEIVIGTSPSCDLVLTDEATSGRHLGIRIDGGHVAVRDLGSKNGTLYEGSRLETGSVDVGATLKLGNTFVRIRPLAQPLDVEPSQSRRFGELVAESLVMREVFAVLELAAQSDVTLLIEGETGTGKELAARAIHEHSERRKGPFVAVDCGALPDNLVDSELFGHLRGAFTGANRDRTGAFVRASGGTLFLDELGSVPAPVQARLLRVIEERQVKPVGSDKAKAIDVRIVAASPRDLEAEVEAGTFRPDLFYRLSVVRVILPPLRARREDIKLIVEELLRRRGSDLGEVGGENLDRLAAHDWPGNVRELRNVIDRALALSPRAVGFADLRISMRAAVPDRDATAVRSDLPFSEAKEQVLREFERRYLRDVLARCDGNISAASRESGVDRKHLRTLLRRHDLI